MNAFSLSFTPLLPWPVLAGFGVIAVLLVALWLYAGRRGVLLRTLGLALLLLALADPALVREDRAGLKDIVAIVVDKSGSQTIGERRDQTEKAKEALEKALAGLNNVDLRVIEAGADADADGTRLFAALNAGLADAPSERIGAVFMITDGLVHDIPANADALGFKAPLHALITGHEGERDRRIELLEAPRFGIVGKDQTIELKVVDSAGGGEPVTLRVSRDGVEIATLVAAPGERLRVPVGIEHGGPNVVELAVDALPDELTALNNKAVVTIEGVRDKLKVLLVSGEPHAGERMWRNILKSDANVDLVHFTILRPPEKQDGTPINELSLIAFPTADLFGRKIGEFDLIVFDRYSNQSVLPLIYFDNIVHYVREGGALLLAAGPDFAGPDGLFFSPLGRIAPARPDGGLTQRAFRAVISDEGAKHPVTRGLPGSEQAPPAWSPWFRQVNAEVVRGTSVLNGADKKPLLVLSREGKGRIALLLSDQMWLWARGFEGGGPHLDLLRRLAHWLMKEPELEEEALRANVRGHHIEIERQSLLPTIPPVTVTAPSGEARSVELTAAEPGVSRASVEAKELGLYRLSDGVLSVLANVGPDNPREFQDVVSTTEKLRPLAEATGGVVRRIASGAGSDIVLPRIVAMRESPLYGGADYAAIKRAGASEVRGVGFIPLAIGVLGLAALLGGVLAAWVFEGRGGAGRMS
ncbi:membrane protein [Methylocapsa acidiphila]|uniref:membrane protein n=1 Tax=Methylocapsa acidiphila TaxID=133552 RepID=UPI0003FA8128|nr:membrane protein [Methylocapsa acidiphila]